MIHEIIALFINWNKKLSVEKKTLLKDSEEFQLLIRVL